MIRRNEYVSVHETRAQVTREKLLKAAIKLVNRDGMKQLTVRNICDEAGLSTGSFYNLFSGKEDLISYYLKYAFVPYREKALVESEPYNPIERILIIYRAYVVYCKDMGLEFVSGLYASNHNRSLIFFIAIPTMISLLQPFARILTKQKNRVSFVKK